MSILVILCSLLVVNVVSQDEKLLEEYQLEEFSTRMGKDFNTSTCNISKEQKEDLQNYKSIVQQIFDTTTKLGSPFSGKTYKDLGTFVDKFGSRISGSEALEKSIVYMTEQMKESGYVDVHTENVTVPKWLRS